MLMADSFAGATTEIEIRNTAGNWTTIQSRRLSAVKTLWIISALFIGGVIQSMADCCLRSSENQNITTDSLVSSTKNRTPTYR